MEDWGLNPSTVGAIGSISVLVAFVGLLYQIRLNRRARYLQAALTISGRFRDRWENGWETLLREKIPTMKPEDRDKGETGRHLTYMLNWLDWMSLLVKKKWIDKDILFASLGFVIEELLRESAVQLQNDMKEKGEGYWSGVAYIARQINVDIGAEAEKLRQKWGSHGQGR